MQSATKDTVTAIDEISIIVSKMNEMGTSVANSVSEQDQATIEIAQNVERAAEAAKNVSEQLREIQTATQESLDMSDKVSDTIQLVSGKSTALNQNIREFLQKNSAI